MKKRIIRNILSLLSVITFLMLLITMIKIDVISTKYLTIFIIIELIVNLLGIVLNNLKKKVLVIIGIIILVITIILNVVGFYYLDKTNTFIDKGFSNYVTVKTDYVVITSANNNIDKIDNINKSIYYYKYSRSIDLALKKMKKYSLEATDNISDVLNTINNDPNNYLLISRSNYDYLFDSSILYDKNNYKIVKEFSVSYKEKKSNTVKDSYTVYLNGVDFTGVMRDFNMLVTVNTKSKKIVLTSILRGYYIDVPAYNIKDTLMCLGSLDSEVSKEALEELFDTDIDYTFNVNTNSLVTVVDTLGGVTINIESQEELKYLNSYIDETAKVTGKSNKKVSNIGKQNLNGVQAVAYSRIRYTAGGDYKRTERMRTVIEAMANKLKTKNIGEINNFADQILPKVYTNISAATIMSMIPDMVSYKISNSIGWPYETKGITLDRWYGVPVTLESNVTKLHKDVFNDNDYVVPESIKTTSNTIIKKTGYK